VEDSAAEAAETQANGRFRPGASGKPAGRPTGATNKTTLPAQEALIIAVAAGQVPPCDAECVMNLIDRFGKTLKAEKDKAWLEAYTAERERQAAAKVTPVSAPAAAEEYPVVTDPDLDAYASMSWPKLIDAMWDAEEGAVNIDARTGKYRSPRPSRPRRFADDRHAMRRSMPPRRPLVRSSSE